MGLYHPCQAGSPCPSRDAPPGAKTGRRARPRNPPARFLFWDFLLREMICLWGDWDGKWDLGREIISVPRDLLSQDFCPMGFKAHDGGRGPRLGRQVGLGPPGMARRFGVAGAASESDSRDLEISRLRAEVDRLRLAREALASGSTGRRGRPRVEGERPWELAGLSRTEWYRRRKGRAEGGVG